MSKKYLGPPKAASSTCANCGSIAVRGPLPGRTRGTIREMGDVIWPPLRACLRCGAICETVYPMIEFSLERLEKGDWE
jgi:hypothetical protein